MVPPTGRRMALSPALSYGRAVIWSHRPAGGWRCSRRSMDSAATIYTKEGLAITDAPAHVRPP